MLWSFFNTEMACLLACRSSAKVQTTNHIQDDLNFIWFERLAFRLWRLLCFLTIDQFIVSAHKFVFMKMTKQALFKWNLLCNYQTVLLSFLTFITIEFNKWLRSQLTYEKGKTYSHTVLVPTMNKWLYTHNLSTNVVFVRCFYCKKVWGSFFFIKQLERLLEKCAHTVFFIHSS